MPDASTLGDLYKAKRRTDDDLNGAVAGYLADPTPGPREIADGITLDIAAAMLAHKWSAEELAVPDANATRRRNAVRTAILLAPV